MNEILRMYNRPDGSVVVEFFVKPVGYVRQNWKSRHRQDRLGERIEAYNDYKATLRDNMFYAMIQQGIKKFPKAPLWMRANFCFYDREEMMSRSNDIDNLIKSVLDSCNRILIPDDRWVIQVEGTKGLIMNGSERVIFRISTNPIGEL